MSATTDERRAHAEIRLALLRATADLAYDDLDPSGWLSAQLRDFADLLEVAERLGWFDSERRGDRSAS